MDDQRPDQKRIRALKTILEQEKVAVTVRYSRGLAANAACSCIYFFAEIVAEERRHQPPLVFGDQAVLVLADIVTILNRCQDRGIGRRAADAQFFHALDQGRFGIARRWLREMLLRRDAALFCRFLPLCRCPARACLP